MVVSHNLGELVLPQRCSNTSDRQYQDKNHYYNHQNVVCRSGQSAQDKRSRLSNVINNLKKKVPESGCESCDTDGRNSVERNLETLEKYVMTVLNGVIKDAETEGRGVSGINGIVNSEDTSRFSGSNSKEDARIITEDDRDPVVNHEPSEPSAVEPAVPDGDIIVDKRENEDKEMNQSSEDESLKMANDTRNCNAETVAKTKEANPLNATPSVSQARKSSLDQQLDADVAILDVALNDKVENSNMDQSESSVERVERSFASSEDIRIICRDILNDLLNDISQMFENEESIDPPTTSFHCSLPLDKVAPALQTYESVEAPTTASQVSPKSSPKSSPSSTVRHLCLYCDRKFLSISLRQRHIERVHQLNGGRRSSERNGRKATSNCLYCSDKYIDSLESFFQHMVACHSDKYHFCLQCNIRFASKDGLAAHMRDTHSSNERISEALDRSKDTSPLKELHSGSREATFIQGTRDLLQEKSETDKRDNEHHRLDTPSTPPTSTKLNMFQRLSSNKDFSNPASPDFDSSFYSSVSCNIRENLLHHLDGKLLNNANNYSLVSHDIKQPQQQHYQSFHESGNQIQFPIDISLTAATPVDSKEYSPSDKCENSSKYAQKPGKTSRSHPRRVSFEKYNFPRKYDGKEQWTCSIKDLSKFDIYTQLTLKKKQELLKEKNQSTPETMVNLSNSEIGQTNLNDSSEDAITPLPDAENTSETPVAKEKMSGVEDDDSQDTQFSLEFGNFMKLRRWDECPPETIKSKEIVYAELTGEWSRPRVYICGACSSRYLTLKEMEDHKVTSHPNVWCSHLEFSGDQRELYKHLFLPGKSAPAMKIENNILPDKICTKCSKACNTLAELHRHMLECGGDQAWLLGLFGNGKKKCKWRPFGSRSRRRRQRGMKRNIQNSQTPRVNQPKEKQPSGPRVRPSDFESIQKMLANLPAKRSTRRDIQETQSRLRKGTNQSRHLGENISSNTRLSSKAVLRNKLIKNAKSFQRKRCRGDNISAAIESVINNYKPSNRGNHLESKRKDEEDTNGGSNMSKELKEINKLESSKFKSKSAEVAKNVQSNNRSNKMVKSVGIVSKRKKLKIEEKRQLKSVNKISSTKQVSMGTEKKESTKSGKSLAKKSTKDELNQENQRKVYKSVSDNVLSRKRKSDPQSSLNASIKAKTQLRTHDGKFARNPERSASSQCESLGSSSQLTRTRTTRSDPGPLVTRSRLRTVVRKESNIGLKKRITRMSSDSDKMPTLEPVDGLMVCQEETKKSSNNLPILSPVTPTTSRSSIRVISSKLNETNKKKINGRKGRQSVLSKKLNKVESNNEKESSTGIELEDDASLKQGRDLRVRKRKSFSPKIPNSSDKDEPLKRQGSLRELKSSEDDSDVAKKNSKPQVVTSVKKNEPYKVLESRKARQERRTGSLEELSHLQEVPLEVKKLLGPKDDLFTQIGIAKSPKSRRNLRQFKQTTKNKINFTRRSKVISNNKELNSSTDAADEKLEKFQSKKLNKSTDWSENSNESIDQVDSSPKINTSEKQIIDSEKLLTKNSKNTGRNLRSKKSIVELESPPIKVLESESIKSMTITSGDNCDKGEEKEEEGEEHNADDSKSEECQKIVTADLVSLSFEHLQQESSNSNIDSGKENLSETPVNISKAKISRPKKCRGFRRDRVVKRTLNNVIGILTEGVNIPVEVQQNVVLTVQTSIDNMNANSGIQNSRVELDDNGVSPNTVSSVIINENVDENHRIINECVSNDNDNKESNNEEIQCTNNSNEIESDNALLKNKSESNLKTENNVSDSSIVKEDIEEPNDIILDLSRRKTKGKGSFLEKIVSKIAKQKDALLEGEVGSLLDHAVDELSIILDEVGPVLGESNESAKNLQRDEIDETYKSLILSKENNEELKEVKDSLVTENNIKEDSRVDVTVSDYINNINENNCETLENVNEITQRTSKKRSLEVEETTNKRKTVEQIEVEADKIEDDLCLDDIIELINTPKRESLVINENEQEKVRPGKRKNADRQQDRDNDDEGNDTNVCSSENCGKPQIDVIKPNKKSKQCRDDKNDSKIVDSPVESNKNNNSPAGNNSKINSNQISQDEENNQSKESKETEKLEYFNDQAIESTDLNQDKIDNQSMSSELNPLSNKVAVIEANLATIDTKEIIKNDCTLEESIDGKKKNLSDESKLEMKEEKSTKLRKRNNKKKSGADKNLELSENEVVKKADHSFEHAGSGSNIDDAKVLDQINSENNPNSSDVSQKSPSMNAEKGKLQSFKNSKTTEITETPQNTKTRGSKKKSLADEHLELTDDVITPKKKLKDTLEDTADIKNSSNLNIETKENSFGDTRPKGLKSKKKKDDDDCFQVNLPKEKPKTVEDENNTSNDTLIERRKTLKRKAKENIFLIEALLDFYYDTDSLSEPESAKTSNEALEPVGDSQKASNETEKVISKENIQTQLDEIENKNNDEKISTELTSPTVETPALEPENAVDDGLNVKKRASGNFAVVHTKSGEILIVEKKKKFTKEAAKFFCNVCTTSFTRKSSLKKHNQSQSHLLQVTKVGADQENQEELMSLDDATVSSIDRSEITVNEDHLETTTTTTDIMEEKKDDENNVKEKQSDEKNTENNKKLPEVKNDLTEGIETKSTLNNQMGTDLEDELLDEEISKITEHMTHDEYVLTDHISPMPEGTSTPVKEANESLAELSNVSENEQKLQHEKINLADEHLNLDSPILADKLQHRDDHLNKFTPGNSLFTPEDGLNDLEDNKNTKKFVTNLEENNSVELNKISDLKQTLDESKVSLDFTNITEKLKNNEFIKNNSKSSDGNNLDVNLKNDLEIENNSELNEQVEDIVNLPSICDNLLSKEKSIDIDTIPLKRKKERSVDCENFDNIKKCNRSSVQGDAIKKDNGSELNRKLSKSVEKIKRAKSKNKNSNDKVVAKKLIEDSSDSEYDEKNTSEAQSKGKIVKSVFGRALTGEKVDKVKEVLDDWVSRFDSDSQENSRGNNWRNRKDEKKNKHEKSLSNTKSKVTLKKNNFNLDQSSSRDTNELSINSRCRQSKKRAEERISRAFEEESIPYELAYEIRKQSNSIKNIINYESLIEEGNQDKLETDSVKSSDSKKSKMKENELINEINENVDEKDEGMDEFNSNYTNLKPKTDEFLFPDTNSMESIHTRVPSCPRERSSTPDLVSLTTRDSENDAEIGTDVEDDNEDIIRGRLSPSYVSNLPESSIDSASNSEDKANKDESVKINRRSSGEFSGERIFIRSTVSSQESRSGVVTIAPTDAIEDNALDVPQETEESLQKSRSGKVLNFDEELFVECCSRLKATTENELRGTKKIKLDHLEHYESKVDQNIPRTNRGRWKDTDNQNSLGSLLESVNQLLGEEMYSRNRANEYHKRSQGFRSETPSPVTEEQSDFIQTEHPAYEDSLDVAFEHNNKLRDKIQQRMRESENLIATSFSHKSNSISNSNDDSHHRHHHHHHRHHHHHHHHHRQQNHSRHHDNSHHQKRHHEKNYDDYNKNNDNLDNSNNISTKHLSLESVGLKNKMDSNLDGLLDKALSNILHNNGKNDHNASTPMNVLAELACAQVPTSTISEVKFTREKIPKTKTLSNGNDWLVSPQSTDKIERDQLKKPRNPIKELFERKNELNDRKQHENSCITSSEKESIGLKQKMKKVKRQDDFPLIRKGPFRGMSERKKRRNDKKREIPNKIKDVYEFDDEESGESRFGTTLSYRSKNEKSIASKAIKSKEINVAELVSRTITKTLENDKAVDPLGKRLENMIERKFQEIESSIPKTKGALKAYHVEEKQQQSIRGPMDNFVERKLSRRLSVEHLNKHNKTKKKTKNSKKRSRNAWYENDSSDEFVTAIKKENIGVGISKSQRTCSKGKQNLFAELSTSSESEYDDDKVIYQSNKIINSKERIDMNSDIEENYEQQLDNSKINNWIDINCKNDFENKKSESDLSDQPLIIDEKKESDEQDNSDNDTDNRSEHVFELDDLYREDSSVVGSDCEENSTISRLDKADETQKDDNSEKHDLIPLEKALDLLESSENLEEIPTSTKTSIQTHSRDIFERDDEIKRHEDDDFDEMLETKDSFKNSTVVDELNELTELPEKLTTNEKPDEKASDNLPLHVFLSRKVQESKKRKEEQLKKQQEEERVAMEFQSTRRQRKCAIGKQGLLAEISSSDEEYYFKNTMRRSIDKSDYDKSRRQKRESKEKKKERYMEKKHEQIIAKEQKAIEEEILRELELKKEINAQDDKDIKKNSKSEKKKMKNDENDEEMDNKKHQRLKKNTDEFLNVNKIKKDDKFISDIENKTDTTSTENETDKRGERKTSISSKKEHSTSSKNSKKTVKSNKKSTGANKKGKNGHDYSRSNSTDDEELRTTKSWNKVEEGVGVAIGRRKRAAANQLYYWSSSSDDDEEFIQPSPEVEEEDDRQEQHGWIVGDSHKKMITMLAMEKQLKEKRRRSEEEFGNIKTKSKKHRNSTS
ncbi:uncharacterized protein PF11_0213-like [Chelonus insularis]|uniref:uncharacterized protein PF11_0213-like n=1 Tax=Chelonus insularis TaxID=460826 RepID=UPI00158C1642|nr:uncharacterized protein PF11_0213-like [Chelonus insularis]